MQGHHVKSAAGYLSPASNVLTYYANCECGWHVEGLGSELQAYNRHQEHLADASTYTESAP